MSSKLTETEHPCGFCHGQLHSSKEIVKKIHSECKLALKRYANIKNLIEEFRKLNDESQLEIPLPINIIAEMT